MKLNYRTAKAMLQSHPYIMYDELAVEIAITLLYQHTGGNKWINPTYLNHFAKEAESKAAILRNMIVKQKECVRGRLVRETDAYLERRDKILGVAVESNSLYQEPTREPVNKQSALVIYEKPI